jgi:hypothetical protein
VDDLNSLEIEPEVNPGVETRLETVVEVPVRNEKKKVESPKVIQQASSIVKEPVVMPSIVEQPKQVEQPTPQPQVQSVQPQFNGLDDYINRTAEAVKQQWRDNAYQTLIGVVTGQLQVVAPQTQVPQQQQPVQQAQPIVQERVVVEKDNSEAVKLLKAEVAKIDMKIIDSESDVEVKTLQGMKRLLRVQIQKLEGTYVDQPEVEQPVSDKVVKPQKKGEGGNVTPKIYLAGIALAMICGIGIILLINSLWH